MNQRPVDLLILAALAAVHQCLSVRPCTLQLVADPCRLLFSGQAVDRRVLGFGSPHIGPVVGFEQTD